MSKTKLSVGSGHNAEIVRESDAMVPFAVSHTKFVHVCDVFTKVVWDFQLKGVIQKHFVVIIIHAVLQRIVLLVWLSSC